MPAKQRSFFDRIDWGLIIPIVLISALAVYTIHDEYGAEMAALCFFGAIFLALAIYLAMRPWFWIIAFYLGAAACFLTMLAYAVHFQILAALGMCVIGFISGFIGRVIGVAYYRLNGFF
ncbi:hypothetical protein [Microbulbifer celer]|uniref:Uncharacterized protein n=1 Tax=Microbulbifer celer TaxID=435905 RepID=A0ABW3U9C8_9GAMM|nr:hypothetical protein [Microbulbifer celer]UFN58589.1 hypothetical protein LPW13_05970 [Microbulbifer celer]